MLALAGARMLDHWLPPAHSNAPAPTTVIVNPPPDADTGRHRRRRDDNEPS
jgi:hypothetical protein